MKIYVASSWRNRWYPSVVGMLRSAAFDVYADIDQDWQSWSTTEYIDALRHPIARQGFASDIEALRECDVCVLVGPSGRSAHLELGWAIGAGKRSAVLLMERQEPELMYRMADYVTGEAVPLLRMLRDWSRAA